MEDNSVSAMECEKCLPGNYSGVLILETAPKANDIGDIYVTGKYCMFKRLKNLLKNNQAFNIFF